MSTEINSFVPPAHRSIGDEPPLTRPAHTLSGKETAEQFATDLRRGLSEEAAARRREVHGYNELAEAPPVPLSKKFLKQFTDLVIWILIVAAVVSGVVGDWPDTVAILAIVLLNGILGFLQEERAERALEALRKLSAPQATVRRDGEIKEIAARELVPGDVIELEAGDSIAADARLVEAFALRAQEAALTGESVPVEKNASDVLQADAPLGDRRNMLYAGTVAAAGKATAVVVGTGVNTELGHIAGMLQRFEAEPTPLQRRLGELGKVLVVVCLVVVAVIFTLQLLRGGELLEMFLVAVSLAVAAVPEGLPAVVTIALALGLRRMVRRNALIRKLPSVETLGSVTVICSDKTGTLTRNEMTVRLVLAGGCWYRVSGAGYEPEGRFLPWQAGDDEDGASLPTADANFGDAVDPSDQPDLILALSAGARCNNASLTQMENDPDGWQVIGDPTEASLIVVARKAGIAVSDDARELLREIPFDSERKAMSVIVRESGDDGSTVVMYTKGASEVILAKCVAERRDGEAVPLSDERREEILEQSAAMAAQALRVLALAYRPIESGDAESAEEKDFVFAGLAGMIDPPREEAKEAVGRCYEAGIRPVMITGDHPATAVAIARELEITDREHEAVTGADLDRLSDEDLAERVEDVAVYARVSAEHKLRVIQAWRRRGQVVAMTGDGINDAPAVKTADIGIAMGLTGTDVTKEASDMVLMDDNFASIVAAVEEGRGIFDNIQKFVHYLLSCNAGEVLFMFFAALVGWPAPLAAIQILWINLVTDGLPALALGMEPTERDVMQRKPRPPREPVITLPRGLQMIFHGLLMALVGSVGFWMTYRGDPSQLDRARAVAFGVIAFCQLFFSLSCRSHTRTMPELGPFTNRPLLAAIAVSGLLQLGAMTSPLADTVFEVKHPLGSEWVLVLLLALVPVTVIESIKLVRAWLSK